ncbi:IS1595 family transposase [Clostridium tertium]|uniref:IS1595 family transposase n=1 Tax=Clostridium tertium TaxID=1559 RepID=UPI0024B36BF2|nr:IS1595 family transposase [Clostridium tertium]MDI9217187.1 IS1595 family transposase [Clostridium tertium]
MKSKNKTIIEYSNDPIKENTIKNIFKTINDHLDYLNTIDIFKDKKIKSCPYCQNSKFIKHGKFRDIQRYKCKNINCSKTFSAKTNSPFSYSKKNITLWMKYLSLMNSGTSIRSCARILGINIATSFYWRHKILVAEASNNNFKILKDYVEANKIMIKENFKGNKKSKTFNREKIFIICAMDNNESILSKAICRYSISLASISKNFYPNLDKSAFLATSGDRCLVAFAKKHNSTIPKTKLDKLNEIKSESLNAKNTFSYITLPHIHSFSFNIYRWLKKFKGVATKYLENYLSWYILDYKSNYSLGNSNQIILLKKLNDENIYLRIKDFSTFKLSYQYTCIGNY